MSRLAGDWIETYMRYSEELEAPDCYHRWIAISVISSVLRRNVWINQGHYSLFPNMFVILVGPAGKIGKSTCIRAGRKLLLPVPDIIFGPDSGTRAHLIKFMAGLGAPGKQSAVVIHSTELSSIIEQSQEAMIAFLTDIYDCEWNPKGWKDSTKTQGEATIHNPCVNILAGTTPSWLGDGLPIKATEHGFTARTIFIYADEPRFLNPRPKEPSEKLAYNLTEDLKTIATLSGPIVLSTDAWNLYEEIYEKVGKGEPEDYRLAGYHWRKAKVHLLKAAIIMSISASDSLRIERRDLEKAANALDEIEVDMPKAFSSVGKNPYSTDIERIQRQILSSPVPLAKDDVISKNYSVGNSEIIQELLDTIMKSGQIRQVRRDGKDLLIPSERRVEGGA